MFVCFFAFSLFSAKTKKGFCWFQKFRLSFLWRWTWASEGSFPIIVVFSWIAVPLFHFREATETKGILDGCVKMTDLQSNTWTSFFGPTQKKIQRKMFLHQIYSSKRIKNKLGHPWSQTLMDLKKLASKTSHSSCLTKPFKSLLILVSWGLVISIMKLLVMPLRQPFGNDVAVPLNIPSDFWSVFSYCCQLGKKHKKQNSLKCSML